MKKNKILLVCALALGLPSAVSSLMHNIEPIVARAETLTKTINFGSKNEVKFNKASLSQTIDNVTWNFTATGTTSFTPQPSYNQIGSSSKPATSINIISGYYQNMTLSSFEIKLGGFGGTAGNIACNYAGESIVTGKLNGANDILLSNKEVSIIETDVSKGFDISISNISKGVKLYYISYTFIEKTNPDVKKFKVTYDYNYENSKNDSTIFTEGDDALTLPEPTRYGYNFNGWFTNKEGTGEAVKSPYSPTDNVTLYAKWEEKTKYTITFMMNDGTDTVYEKLNVIENEVSVSPTESPTRNGFRFTGWYTDSNTNTEYNFDLKINQNITLYAGWVECITKQDTLVATDLSAINTTYKNFSNVKKDNATYAGRNSKTNSGAIQLNNKNDSGIVSTKSDGFIRKVIISWEESTTDGRRIDVYGSNTAYSLASELYSDKTSGKLLSSKGIVKGTSTELIINNDYKYVGIKSNNGALYIKSISFEWEPIKPTVDETILKSSYLFTEMTDGENISNGIRFVGSVKEDKFVDLSSVGFKFTLSSTDKNVTKDYAIETTKLYNIIDDSNKFAFKNKEDETFTLDGYLSYSLILNNISETFNATITFYSYAIIDGVTYNSETTTINIVNGVEA